MPAKHEGGIESYPPNFLRCRARRHAWDKEHWSPITNGRGTIVGWLEQLECLRCEQPRHCEYDTELRPVTTAKIDYTDGYLVATGEEKIDPTRARQEIVRQMLRTVTHHSPQPLEA
jgi:hypothetical protein